ncbi:MAG: extracellular solute-binding protein [Paenibacillaceae bacterium]|nr:extracellular solute-binding protein [Paenibacillaceae bacterium]
MKWAKSAGITLVASSLAFTVACSNDSEEAAPSASPVPSAGAAAATAPATAADPLGKFDPPINVRVSFPANASAKFATGENIDNNEWTQAYTSRLGINVKYDFTVPGEQYTTKFNVAMASSDLPDLMAVWATQFQQLVEGGVLEDLGPALEKYGSPELKTVVNVNEGISKKAASFNGKLYGLFSLGDARVDAPKLIYLRKDWLNNLGLQEPKTVTDVLAIAEAFATRDPNGDGKQTEYGIGFDKGLGGNFTHLMNAYGAYPKIWVKDSSNNLVMGTVQPEVKTVLGKLADLYKKGVLDKEFGAKDNTTAGTKDIAAGRNGLFFTGASGASLSGGVGDVLNNEPKADWALYVVKGENGQDIRYSAGIAPGTLYVAKKGGKNAEALIKMLNFSIAAKEGSEADYKLYYDREVDDGKGGKQLIQAFFHAPFRASNPQGNLIASQAVRKALTSNDASGLTSEQKAYYDRVVAYEKVKDPHKDINNWKYHGIFGPGGSMEMVEKNYMDMKHVQINEYYGPTTEGMGKFLPALDKLMEETFTRIIMGAAPLDEFDSFVTKWKSQGGDQITKEVNEWYKTQK